VHPQYTRQYHTLWQLHGLNRLWHLLVAHEQSAHRGRRYARVVVSRLDYVWLGAHPPLALLMPAECAWVPKAENYGGVSDRHAVLSRAHADVYLSRWQSIMSGAILHEHPALRAGKVAAITGERSLAAHLRAARVPLCRFAPTAHLACCGEAAFGNGSEPTGTKRCQNGRCSRLPLRGASASAASATGTERAYAALRDALRVTHGKYLGELRASFLHGLALRLPGSRWVVRAEGYQARSGELEGRSSVVRAEAVAAAVSPTIEEAADEELLMPHSMHVDVVVSAPRRHALAFNRTVTAALRGKLPKSGWLLTWS